MGEGYFTQKTSKKSGHPGDSIKYMQYWSPCFRTSGSGHHGPSFAAYDTGHRGDPAVARWRGVSERCLEIFGAPKRPFGMITKLLLLY